MNRKEVQAKNTSTVIIYLQTQYLQNITIETIRITQENIGNLHIDIQL